MLPPEKVGLLTAAEEGLQANIFERKPDATAWLDAYRKGDVPSVRPLSDKVKLL